MSAAVEARPCSHPKQRRRTVLKAGLGLALAPLLWPACPALGAPASLLRTRLLSEGEAALMRGDAAGAMRAFEQAGALGHDPEIELGLVRAAMQAGRYRQAQGFAAHTAGEHMRDAACVAINQWLLGLGGQDAMARQSLREAMAETWWSASDQVVLDAVGQQWAHAWPWAGGVLRQGPLRLAPYAHGAKLPARARSVANATLLQDATGRQVVVAPAWPPASPDQRWWVRNGLGLTVAAHPLMAAEGGPVLTLQPELPLPGGAALAARDPFPGSPAYAFAYGLGEAQAAASPSETPEALAAWPVMRMGFAGGVRPDGARDLGIDTPEGAWSQAALKAHPLGGPVFDGQGQMVGLALGARAGGRDSLCPVLALRRLLGWPPESAANPMPRMVPDELYERGMTCTLQLITTS